MIKQKNHTKANRTRLHTTSLFCVQNGSGSLVKRKANFCGRAKAIPTIRESSWRNLTKIAFFKTTKTDSLIKRPESQRFLLENNSFPKLTIFSSRSNWEPHYPQFSLGKTPKRVSIFNATHCEAACTNNIAPTGSRVVNGHTAGGSAFCRTAPINTTSS